jgi:hypothetical protein
MIDSEWFMRLVLGDNRERVRPSVHVTMAKNKKADVAEHPKVFHHVGLLSNGRPDFAGLPFI